MIIALLGISVNIYYQNRPRSSRLPQAFITLSGTILLIKWESYSLLCPQDGFNPGSPTHAVKTEIRSQLSIKKLLKITICGMSIHVKDH
jgi:hypothetical protein